MAILLEERYQNLHTLALEQERHRAAFEKHQEQKEAYAQALALQNNSTAIGELRNYPNLLNASGIFSAGQGAAPPDPNSEPALQIALADLYNLWCVTWGDQWVTRSSLGASKNDGFDWTLGVQRLQAVNKLETIASHNAYRIIPHDVWK